MLIVQVDYKIDLVKQLKSLFPGKKEIMVLKEVIQELEKLGANLALENVLKQKLKVLDIPGPRDVDEKIISSAKEQNAFIATNDKLLREKAKKQGISCLAFNKSKKRLMVV